MPQYWSELGTRKDRDVFRQENRMRRPCTAAGPLLVVKSLPVTQNEYV